METRKSKANQKRQRQIENRPLPQRKHQQRLDKSQQLVSSDQPIKITDLDDGCLVKVFGHLDLRSIFNVTMTNERFRLAAGIVYKRKFGTKVVRIGQNYDGTLRLTEDSTSIKVSGLKRCFQFLRCLGSSISSLEIEFVEWNNKEADYIHRYINEYCADSLENIEFWCGPYKHPIKYSEKPFVNVRTVELWNSDLDEQFPSFTHWFPNIRTLKLFNVRTDKRYIGTSFHHLQDLRIDVCEDSPRHFKSEDVAALLNMCPQLRSLHIRQYGLQQLTLNAFLDIIKDNPKICNLNVSTARRLEAVMPSEIKRLLIEGLSMVELNLLFYKFTADDAIVVIQQLNSLKQFCFAMDESNQWEYDRFAAKLDRMWQVSSDSVSNRRIITVKRR